MGFLDDIGKAFKKVEEEVQKSDLDKHLKNVEEGLNKAGRDISAEAGRARAPAQPAQGQPEQKPATGAVPRASHPGYVKIAAWMKRNYQDRISVAGDKYQTRLALEQIAAEATAGIPAKARKGFMEYLKNQNYEPLLK